MPLPNESPQRMTPNRPLADAGEPLLVDPRHNGPPASGNGGWVAGALARRLGVPVVSVALRAPVPLGQPMQVARVAGARPASDIARFARGV